MWEEKINIKSSFYYLPALYMLFISTLTAVKSEEAGTSQRDDNVPSTAKSEQNFNPGRPDTKVHALCTKIEVIGEKAQVYSIPKSPEILTTNKFTNAYMLKHILYALKNRPDNANSNSFMQLLLAILVELI